MTFSENSTVLFDSNIARDDGGAIFLAFHSSVTFKDNSTTLFINNTVANQKFNFTLGVSSDNSNNHGGAIFLTDHSNISFKGCSNVSFDSNIANINTIFLSYGGAICLKNHSSVKFKENCTVTFNNNIANDGGAVYATLYSNVKFSGHSAVAFSSNRASDNAGALYSQTNSVTFDNNTTVLFMNNRAGHDGGAMCFYNNSVIIKGNSIVTFANNAASSHGGACGYHSVIILYLENATVTFTKNNAEKNGGALFLSGSFNVTFNKAEIKFSYNSADVGGVAFTQLKPHVTVNFNITQSLLVGLTIFYNNRARIYGKSVFLSVNELLLSKHLLGIRKGDLQQGGLTEYFNTIPYKVVLRHPAIICTEFDNDKYCMTYQVNNIMLGQVVTIYGCVYDYFDSLVKMITQFQISNLMYHENYDAHFLENILITCQPTQGFEISIVGNKIVSNDNLSNYSVMLTSLPPLQQWKSVSLKLSIQLSSCHLGFQHNDESKKCECYNEGNIVTCSGSTSAIKRGYWFGTVTEKLTVAICPINYCDFSCCETNNGYHQLLPARENQCASHRSGIVCGRCEEGYTLSYSADCVSDNKCTVGWTLLVVTLTVLYWIAIVVVVFAMMYFKLPIGYLYAITYYYSVIDVLLNQDLHHFSSLHAVVIIISSVFKLTPQFLGQLCLVKGLSGIDIQFIHYVHPLAVSIILVMISLSAKYSLRFSSFISRGIIHVICYLLLLSYTAMASTSLLLMRSLTLHNVDTIFTYLSPDIEYLHGRHIAYFIVAVMCTITIVIDLPLLLLLEPFLNHKINFTRIKPLLDQFQGCYKDKYRWFAAYYMICRLVLVAIIIYSSNYFITQYLLVIISVIIALVPLITMPYNKEVLNMFDQSLAVDDPYCTITCLSVIQFNYNCYNDFYSINFTINNNLNDGTRNTQICNQEVYHHTL